MEGWTGKQDLVPLGLELDGGLGRGEHVSWRLCMGDGEYEDVWQRTAGDMRQGMCAIRWFSLSVLGRLREKLEDDEEGGLNLWDKERRFRMPLCVKCRSHRNEKKQNSNDPMQAAITNTTRGTDTVMCMVTKKLATGHLRLNPYAAWL